jgi:hypothetical protein
MIQLRHQTTRPRYIDSKLVLKAKEVVGQTANIRELKAAQAVLAVARWSQFAQGQRSGHPR